MLCGWRKRIEIMSNYLYHYEIWTIEPSECELS